MVGEVSSMMEGRGLRRGCTRRRRGLARFVYLSPALRARGIASTSAEDSVALTGSLRLRRPCGLC